MIKFKLNGKTIPIPTSWDEVTYKQFVAMFDMGNDTIQLVSIFTGLEYDYLKKSVIVGLNDILKALSFINNQANFPGSVNQVGPYKIPNNSKGAFNIQHESLAQFEDMRSIMAKVPQGDIKAHTQSYVKYCAIYVQKLLDGEYRPLMVPELEDELETYPAYQICSLGAFFFLNLLSLSIGTQNASRPTVQNQKKSKPVMKGSKKRSARLRPSRKRHGR